MNGYESARHVTHAHGKSFAFAAFALPKEKRLAAYAVYAFFRRLDDLFDGGPGDLREAHAAVAWLYGDDAQHFRTWPQNEMHALREAIARYALPRHAFEEMLAGMEMDLRGQSYDDERVLDLYCYRVAGTVGEIMGALLDAKDIDAAVALGKAMQRTNILRDVDEDRTLGRTYLPAHVERAPFIAETRSIYARARRGIASIDSFSGRFLVQMMARIYADILRVIERGAKGRAYVSLPRKLWLMCVAFVAAVKR